MDPHDHTAPASGSPVPADGSPIPADRSPAPARHGHTSWTTAAAVFLVAAACAFGSAALHGPIRGVLLGVSGALIVCGGMIVGIRAARHSDAAAARRLQALSRHQNDPR